MSEMATETERAIKELELAGLFDKDSDYGGMTGNAVKELLEVFQAQEHSGASAGQTASIFSKLATGGVLTPLTGKEAEWADVSCTAIKPMFQNKRASHVFAEDCNGSNAYDIQGKVFEYPNGGQYINAGSRVKVIFPYMPKVTVVKVDEDGNEMHEVKISG